MDACLKFSEKDNVVSGQISVRTGNTFVLGLTLRRVALFNPTSVGGLILPPLLKNGCYPIFDLVDPKFLDFS